MVSTNLSVFHVNKRGHCENIKQGHQTHQISANLCWVVTISTWLCHVVYQTSVLSRPPSIGGGLRLLGGRRSSAFGARSSRRRRRDRDAEGVEGVGNGAGEWGGGIPLPSRLGSLGERRELPQRGPGQSPGRKRIWCTLELSESHYIYSCLFTTGGSHFECF